MKKDKDTDNIFREKLKDFSVSPPPYIWNNVLASLAAQKRKRRIAYISWISAAAVVLFAFIGGWYFSETHKEIAQSTIQNESIKSESKTNENNVNSELNVNPLASSEKVKSDSNNTSNTSDETEKSVSEEKQVAAAAFTIKEKPSTEKVADEREVLKIEPLIPVNPKFSENENSNILSEKSNTDSHYEELSQTEKNIIAENVSNLNIADQKHGNWKMGMNVAPGYSSHVASHSESYAQNMTYSGSDGNANMSGGISVQYKTPKKWSFESGVYYAQNGQKSKTSVELFALNNNSDQMFGITGDTYFSNAVKLNNGKMEMNSTAGVIAFSGTPKGAEVSSEFDESRINLSNSLVSSGEFSQVFDFVEIPFYVRYSLVDSKFGVELIGGFNAGIVVGNNAYIDNEYGLQNVGQTEDISPFNVSGTLGLGLNYALGKHFSLGFEPRFNYYLSSINANPDVDFRPYRIGFYTGVYYEF